jgi:hypothetical protein
MLEEALRFLGINDELNSAANILKAKYFENIVRKLVWSTPRGWPK